MPFKYRRRSPENLFSLHELCIITGLVLGYLLALSFQVEAFVIHQKMFVVKLSCIVLAEGPQEAFDSILSCKFGLGHPYSHLLEDTSSSAPPIIPESRKP